MVNCLENIIEIVPIDLRHVDALQRLPAIHKDPFDRIIVATAIADGYTLATSDKTILQHGADTLDIGSEFLIRSPLLANLGGK